MVFTAFDSFNDNEIIHINEIPYKSNDMIAYRKRRIQGRFKCQSCYNTVTEVDSYDNISKNKIIYNVKNHFRCGNKDCVSHDFNKNKRYNNRKDGKTVEQARKEHQDYVEGWLKYFDKNCHYLGECIKIDKIKTIVIFSQAIITFEIIKKIKTDNRNYKIIVILDEQLKNRLIVNEPYYVERNGIFHFEIFIPKKNDIKYCLDNDFDVYLDTGKDSLLQIKDNERLNGGFYCKLIEINTFLFNSKINKKQIKYIVKDDYPSFMFDDAKKLYEIQKENEMKAKINENERKFALELLKLKKKYNPHKRRYY
jgi:hypothetical protein